MNTALYTHDERSTLAWCDGQSCWYLTFDTPSPGTEEYRSWFKRELPMLATDEYDSWATPDAAPEPQGEKK